jgi:hypothetical protein
MLAVALSYRSYGIHLHEAFHYLNISVLVDVYVGNFLFHNEI